MKTMIGSTLMASTKPTVKGMAPPAGAGAGVATTVTWGQSPKTKRMPALVNPMKASATSLAPMKTRVPTGVRRVTSAISAGRPSPHRMMGGLKALRRSVDIAQAPPRITATPRSPIIARSPFRDAGVDAATQVDDEGGAAEAVADLVEKT